MDPKLCFTTFLFLFLSWSLQGFSEGDQLAALDNLVGQNIGGFLQQAQQEGVLASAVGGEMKCMQNLIPCQSYIHSSLPPESCCTPLSKVISQEKDCLCKAANDPEVLKSLNVSLSEVVNLPYACGQDFDLLVACKVTEKSLTGNRQSNAKASPNADDQQAKSPPSAATPAPAGIPKGSPSDYLEAPPAGIPLPTSGPTSAAAIEERSQKSNAAVMETPAFFYKFVTHCVLMFATFHF